MSAPGIVLLLATATVMLPAGVSDAPAGVTPQFKISKVFTTRGGIHTTTRGTIRLVFVHRGRWLVFHGGPNMYHFSPDGVHWTAGRIHQFDSRSYLIRGDKIYSFAHVDTDPDPTRRKMVAAAFCGTIRGDRIEWGRPHFLPHLTIGYYVDLQQDSTGRFTATGRVPQFDKSRKLTGITIGWARTVRPNDITEWQPQQRVIHHISDMKSSEVHENIPLEDGKSYVIAMLSVNGQGRLYGNLFDGRKWGAQDVLLAENMSTVRGTDKRMSAVWDPKAKVIHLAYVDHDNRLWYRTCKSPYRPEDWSKPVRLKPFKVFTCVLSIDTTKSPAHIWLLYGKTLFEHPDPRWQTGELYITGLDGKSWSEPVLVSEPGTRYNWYPNMNEDASEGIGVLYLKGVPKNQAAIKNTEFDIMFSCTGPPRSAAIAKPADVIVVGKGAHMTTRPHNRHLIYHAGTDTWYAFVGTGKALDERGANALLTSRDGRTWKVQHLFCRGYGTSSSQDALLVGNKIFLLYWPVDWKKYDPRYGGTPIDAPIEYKVREYFLGPSPGSTLRFRDFTAIRGRFLSERHFYGSICRDSRGYFWIGTRCYSEQLKGVTRAFVTRSSHPDDLSTWQQPMEIGRRRGNSVAVDLSALDDGKVIAINHYSPFSRDRGEPVIAAAVYDPQTGWSPEIVVARGNASHRLRGVAEFDPASKRLHLLYPDERGDIRHKILSAPYGPNDWSPKAGEDVPGRLVVAGVDDDISIALDYSKKPATITLVYRKNGTVYRKDYDGQKWLENDTPLVHVPQHSAELSLNLDASKKLGLLFVDTEPQRGRVIKFLELPRFEPNRKTPQT